MSVLNCINALSCAERGASGSDPTGQERALLRSQQLQHREAHRCWQAQTCSRTQEPISTQPTTTADRDSSSPGGSGCAQPGLRALQKCTLHGTCRPHPHDTFSQHVIQGAECSDFCSTSLCSPKSCGGFCESDSEIIVLPARALRQLLLPKRLHQGCNADFNIPAWGKAWLLAHLDYKPFGNENW